MLTVACAILISKQKLKNYPAKTQLLITNSKQLPEKTHVDIVKMVEDNCESNVS